MNQTNNTANLQLELFSEANNSQQNYQQKTNNPVLSAIWNYEKAILMIIAMAVIGIIAFSLGVEKGKKLSGSVVEETQAINHAVVVPLKSVPLPAIKSKESVPQEPDTQSLIVKTPTPLKMNVLALQRNGSFTIQLASYKTKTNAQKEKTTLTKKGFSPMLIADKNYTVICVGNFPNKETAKAMLSELKKTYPGCYIRRL